MSDNPFDEPDDDPTVVRPTPGGRRAAPPPPAPSPLAPQAAPVAAEAEPVAAFQGRPLVAAAQPLLLLLARLRNTLNQPDAGELRARTVAALRDFEKQARAASIPVAEIRAAHYALAASLDDVVLNTPWGSQGAWVARSLVSTFHQETQGGERFFVLLEEQLKGPAANLPVLEVMALCLALGFQGRYRLPPRRPAELEKIREDLHAAIQNARATRPDPELSPRWRGVDAPYRPGRARLPVWVMGSAVAACLGGLFVWASNGLETGTDLTFARAQAAPPATMPQIARAAPVRPPPPPPAPPEPAALDRLRAFLAPEIAQGLVTVQGTDAVPLVRIRNRGMFASGSARLNPEFRPLLRRIGEALRDERGPVLVLGHSDNQPIRTVAFPSNYALSAARAESARDAIAESLGDLRRITAEGRADAEPVASNATPDGREANRRIEVQLKRETSP